VLQVRSSHIVIVFLLHTAVFALFWWGKMMVSNDTTHPDEEAERIAGEPLPQRLVIPPIPPSGSDPGALSEPETFPPLSYAGDTELRPHSSPADPPPEPGKDLPALSPEKRPGQPSSAETTNYENYLKDVLAPALGSPSLSGVRAPIYVVRGLSYQLVQDLLQTGHARIVAKGGEEFFAVKETGGSIEFRRIEKLPAGYAQRGLPIYSDFSQAITHALHREYGYEEKSIMVLLLPSQALDLLILAKQFLAARQISVPLTEIRLTEGRLVGRGNAFTFLVEHIELTDGRVVSIEDGEARFIRQGE